MLQEIRDELKRTNSAGGKAAADAVATVMPSAPRLTLHQHVADKRPTVRSYRHQYRAGISP
ncbi:hypothetical protein [Bifidobacterium sp. UBA4282]|uniref:hypothetical protein n=1 Tax=Bifidobacterium sp. UBA4282 TaxID=1946096 RepID=UPI0025C323FF|nr:hypothetical protein [Bifidobacterium sp. UBA4282]